MVSYFCIYLRLVLCHVVVNRYQGHVLAKELVAKGLQATVITDSAVFAMISRVNMVISAKGFHFCRVNFL